MRQLVQSTTPPCATVTRARDPHMLHAFDALWCTWRGAHASQRVKVGPRRKVPCTVAGLPGATAIFLVPINRCIHVVHILPACWVRAGVGGCRDTAVFAISAIGALPPKLRCHLRPEAHVMRAPCCFSVVSCMWVLENARIAAFEVVRSRGGGRCIKCGSTPNSHWRMQPPVTTSRARIADLQRACRSTRAHDAVPPHLMRFHVHACIGSRTRNQNPPNCSANSSSGQARMGSSSNLAKCPASPSCA